MSNQLTKSKFRGFFEEFNANLPEHVTDSIYMRVLECLAEKRAKAPVQSFIAEYCTDWKERYQNPRNPPISGQQAAAAKAIVEALGLEDAIAMMRTYLRMNEPYFLQRAHDLQTMNQNLASVSVRHETGRSTTREERAQIDRRETNVNAFGAILQKARAGKEPHDP